MRTSYLDQIMRQKDPELLKAVQHLAPGKTVKGIRLLSEQGQLTCSSNGWPSATMTPNARRIPQLKRKRPEFPSSAEGSDGLKIGPWLMAVF
jgi:hypothetical protein